VIAAVDITLVVERGRPDWRLTPTATPAGLGWLVGRPATAAAALLPRVFNLCSAAHAEAAAMALGLPAAGDPAAGDPVLGDAAARAETARRERLRDHAVAVLSDWPVLFGGAPERAALALLGGPAGPAAVALRAALLGPVAAAGLDLSEASPVALDRWLDAGATPTARLLARCRDRIDPAWGRAELALPDVPEIAAALAAGTPAVARETTAADTWRRTPLVAALMARQGASLFVRMLARLVDLLDCLAPRRTAGAPLPKPPAGIGLARAARGLLAHRARLEGGVVADYRVLSPSAWNLAPDGLLHRALRALPIGAETPVLARLVVSCVNPCVPVGLRLAALAEA